MKHLTIILIINEPELDTEKFIGLNLRFQCWSFIIESNQSWTYITVVHKYVCSKQP